MGLEGKAQFSQGHHRRGLGSAPPTETLTAVLLGDWLCLLLCVLDLGPGDFWVSDESQASEGWLRLFEPLQTATGSGFQSGKHCETVLGGHGEGRSLSLRKSSQTEGECQRWDTNVLTWGPHWTFLAFPNLGWVVLCP